MSHFAFLRNTLDRLATKRKRLRPIAFIVVALLVVVSSCLVIRHINQRILDVNCEKVLEITPKGASLFKNELKSTEESLRMFIRLLPEDTAQWESCIFNMLEVHSFYRVTIVTEDGVTASNRKISPTQLTEWKKRQNEDFAFSETYMGDTGTLQTLFHFPFQAHGVRAHLYVERILNRLYNNEAMEFFGSDGFSYVVSGSTGEFLLKARNRNSQGFYTNLYSMLRDNEKNAPEDVERLRALLNEGLTGTAIMQFRGEASYLCFVPIREKTDWYFFSIIPQRTLEDVGNETSIFIFCLVALSLFGCLFIYILNRQADALASKYREQAFRDSTFNAISANIDTVIAVYSSSLKKTEFLSENSGRILGIGGGDLALAQEKFLSGCRSEKIRKLFDAATRQEIEAFVSEVSTYDNPATGETIWLRVSVYKIRNSLVEGKYILTVEDITSDENKTRLLHDAMLAAQRANEAKSTFLTNMSHEIRTPMNAIIGMTVLAQMHLESRPRVQDCLNKIAGASRHLLGLINDILDMSKISSGKMTLSTETFSLSDLLDATATIILPQVNAKGHDFEMHIEGECDRMFEGDPLRIQQMLINILGNAVKYTPENGSIQLNVSVRLRGDGYGAITFVVSDNGIGMSESFQKIIFEPFSQERTKLCRGTGIGMALTSNIVQLMGGTIRFTSTQGKGTTFTVKLTLPVEGNGEEYDTAVLSDRRALLVDDDGDVGTEAVALLREFGMEAESVTSGEAAVDKVRTALDEERPIDIIILDWKMPGMDGLETAKAIRGIVKNDVLIIILSAYDWSAIEEEAAQYGITAFISKPLFKSKLYRTLMDVVERRPQLREAPDAAQPFLGKRFLLAEDNELNIEIASEILSLYGAQVTVAVNGKEAVDRFADSPEYTYDLILMDVQMPICDGYEATRRIRALDRADATIPIVAMTANAFKEDEEKAFAAGMDGYLAKPINVTVLHRTLNAFLYR